MINQIAAKNRFSTSEIGLIADRFSPSSPLASDPAIYVPIQYVCNCGYKIDFNENDFRAALLGRKSNLETLEAAEFDAKAVLEKINEKPFVDFYCPRCKKATRVYFEARYGGKAVNYRLLWIFEKSRNSINDPENDKQ